MMRNFINLVEQQQAVPPYMKAAVDSIISDYRQKGIMDDVLGACCLAYNLANGTDHPIEAGDPYTFLDDVGFDEWYEGNKAQFDIAFSQVFARIAADLDRRFVRGGVIRLHRIMHLPYDPVAAIESGKRTLGIHWSHTEWHGDPEELTSGLAGNYETDAPPEDGDIPVSNETQFYFFVADVPVSSVNWKATLMRYADMQDFENEIRLNPRSRLKLLGVSLMTKDGQKLPLDTSRIGRLRLTS